MWAYALEQFEMLALNMHQESLNITALSIDWEFGPRGFKIRKIREFYTFFKIR